MKGAIDRIGVNPALSNPSEGMAEGKRSNSNPLSDFKNVLDQSIKEIDTMLSKADQSTQEMITGKADIHQAMIDIEQAQISLRMMIQIRNKIISAYEEMMRMQF